MMGRRLVYEYGPGSTATRAQTQYIYNDLAVAERRYGLERTPRIMLRPSIPMTILTSDFRNR